MKAYETPKKGLAGLRHHWREDLLAGVSVTLVALPLALGIAIASGFPPISGLISAIIAGFSSTIFRGSYVSIHAPAAGLATVSYAAYISMDDGSGNTFGYVLAAFVVSGIIQVVLGLLRFGKYGDFFPSAVVIGMLAAIGVIIASKQIHEAFGVSNDSVSAFESIMLIPESIANLNPIITLVAVLSLLILIIYPYIRSRLIRLIPAPMWVLIVAIPLVFIFDFFNPHTVAIFGNSYDIGPQYLIVIPDKIIDGLMFPNFSLIGTGRFWMAVFSICLISSLETLIISKAVDKLDPYKRNTWLNRELVSVGLSTTAAGMVGGLPIIPVIIRSSVNVNNGAKTRWSNLFHSLIVLVFLLFIPGFIQMIPLAALAAILVFTGYKLVSPRVLLETTRKGKEQLLIFLITMVIILFTNILWGIFAGIIVTLFVHYYSAGIPLQKFARYLIKPFSKVIEEKNDSILIKIKGVSNFFNLLHVIKTLSQIPEKNRVIVDFSHARLVDFTVQEYLHSFAEDYERKGGMFDFIGLDIHDVSSHHPSALRVIKQEKKILRLTARQLKIKKMAADNNLPYDPEISYNINSLKEFNFFKSRPVQYKKNTVSGFDVELKVRWEISDINFDLGVLVAAERHHTTVQVIELPFRIPEFSIEKEVFHDKLLELAGVDDIDFEDYKEFSSRFSLKGPDEKAIRTLFSKDIINFFYKKDIYHLESSGNQLLIFKYLRLASPSESLKMYHFSRQLVKKLKGVYEISQDSEKKVEES